MVTLRDVGAQSSYARAADMIDPPEARWRRDPVAWATERAGIELWSKQREVLESVRDNANTAVKSCHSTGKGLWVDTPLPTPTGWVRMGDVQVGDALYDESGQVTYVTATSEIRHLDCYRVTFRSGHTLVCDGDHLWNVLTMTRRRQLRKYVHLNDTGSRGGQLDWRSTWDETETVDTRELIDLLDQSVHGGRPGVPLAGALRTRDDDDVELLIPPYVLGAWLGDGGSNGSTLTNHPKDNEIIEHIEKTGWVAYRLKPDSLAVRLRPNEREPMQPLLRAYGLIKNKHIPAPYLRASYTQRLELLRGLMDTDGHAGKGEGSQLGVGFVNETLARQTYELVRSLGFSASFKVGRATLYDKDCGPFYHVCFSSDVTPFNLSRKTARWRPMPMRMTIRTLESIEHIPTVPTRCITVDSPRGLYLAGHDMIVTHNSYVSSLLVCWWLDVHPVGEARVVTTAPTSAQVDAILWSEINRMHARLGLGGVCHLRDWYFGSWLAAIGRKPPDHQGAAFQGIHAKYMLVIYDEAYGIPKKLWDEGSSIASNQYARQLAIGNPDGPGEFEDVCREGSGWNVIHISYESTPAFTGEQVSRNLLENLISRRWVDDRRDRWGTKSALFMSKCEGNFPSGGDPDSTIPYDWLSQCRYLEYPEDTPYEGGIDVGAGGDRTVIRERRGLKAGREEIFVDPDPMRTVGRLVEKINEWGLTRVKVDVIGIGWALYGRIRELSSAQNPTSKETTHSAEVVPVNFGAGPSAGQKKRFLNKRAEVWWGVGRENARLQRWDLTNVDDDVIAELNAPRYKILDSYGKIQIEAKKESRKRLGVSPDRADALLLAFAEERGALTMPKSGAMAALRSASSSLTAGISPGDRYGATVRR